jgi:cell pole-organizing protein PopZ
MPDQPNMDDILNTIRTDLAEETARVEAGGAADGFDVDLSDDEVLALSSEDLVEGAAPAEGNAAPAEAPQPPAESGGDGLIDLNAFTAGAGLSKVDPKDVAAGIGDDVLGEGLPTAAEPAQLVAETAAAAPAASEPPPAAEGSAEDEMDRLLAEIKQTAAAPAAVNDALLALDEPVAEEVPGVEPEVQEPVVEQPGEAAAPMDVPAVESSSVAPHAPANRMNLSLIPGVSGMQLALPAEILAEALRPLVQDWVRENLPHVVERLVAEEISKMTKQ